MFGLIMASEIITTRMSNAIWRTSDLLIIFQTSVGGDVAASKDKSHGKKASKMLSAMKTSIKGTVETTLGADHLKAKAGSRPSKQRLGVIPRNRANHLSGPIAFKCRYHGKRGHTYISTKETIPCIGFSFDKAIGKNGEDTLGKDEVIFQCRIRGSAHMVS